MRSLLYLSVLLVVSWAVGCSALGHRCIHDEMQRKWGKGVATARILPTHGKDRGEAYEAAAGFAPLRIRVFSNDLTDSSRYCTAVGQKRSSFDGTSSVCTSSDLMTPAKVDTLLNQLLPAAINLHTERLLVKPLHGGAVVDNDTIGSTVCAHFSIPSDHFTTGATDGDTFLYVAAGPTTEGVVAWASTCANAGTERRPVIGAMNFAPRYISASPETIRTAAHEMAHALGFNFEQFAEKDILTVIPTLRGKTKVAVVSSPKTVEKAREHYGCPSAPGMELEDEGGMGTALSHWERRNAKDELMAGIVGIGYYTALTMSAFEGLGFFRANWGKEEVMSWGKDAGCNFLTEKCITNGTTPYTDMFCTAESGASYAESQCTSDRYAVGSCSLKKYVRDLPSKFQYFADPKLGGSLNELADACPFVTAFSNTGCMDGNVAFMPGSIVGPASRCMKGSSLVYNGAPVGDVCALVSCQNETVSIRYAGDKVWHPCPEGGSITPSSESPFSGGTILCPRRSEVCTIAPSTNTTGDDGTARPAPRPRLFKS